MSSHEELIDSLHALSRVASVLQEHEPCDDLKTLHMQTLRNVYYGIGDMVTKLRNEGKIPVVMPGSDQFRGTPGDPNSGKPYVGDPQPLPIGGSTPSPVQGDILGAGQPGDPVVGS